MKFETVKKPLVGISLLSAAVSAQVEAQSLIEELVVTSRKRAETLQEVPDSITAFGRDQIESAGIKGFDDFANLTPNLSLNEGYRPGAAKITIRGMITPQVGDAPIAYVIDGVTAPSIDFINQDLFAIERIEVLRGPQGALYGKGAVGGAINITTRQPGNEIEGQLKATVANGGTTGLNGFVSGPIVEDKLLYQLGASYYDKQGLIDNTFLDKEIDFSERKTVQAMLQTMVNDDLTIDFRAKYADSEDGIGNYSVAPFEAINANDNIEDLDPSANILGVSERDIFEASIKADLWTELGELSFVLGYNDVSEEAFSDGDYTNQATDYANYFYAGAQETVYDVESYTAEFRITGDSEVFEWQAGAYYQDRKTNSEFNWFSDWEGDTARDRGSFDIPASEFAMPTSALDFDADFDTEYAYTILDENSSESWAVFAQADYDFNDHWSMAVALRYDEDKRESFDRRQKNASKASKTFSETQPKLQVTYNWDQDLMTYFSASKGFRSGGFNEYDPTIIRIFDKEVSENVELGFKWVTWGGAMTLSGAMFQIDIADTQFTRLNLDTFTLENLGIDESTSKGVEIEAVVQPAEGLRFNFGYGYSDAEIDKFTADPSLGDIEGNQVPGVHKYNVNLGVEYATALNEGMDVTLRADYIRKGPLAWELDNVIKSDTSDFVNLRAGIQTESYDVTVFVENATDERVATEAFFGASGVARMPNMPRFYGIEASYNF